jgi:hypothetical protein
MADKPLSLAKTAWILYRKEIGKIWPTGLNVFFVSLGILAIAIWLPSSLYLTLPLIGMNFFFAYQLSVSYVRKGNAMDNRQFATFLGAYYRMPFYGCYRIIRNAFFSFLYSLAIGIVVGLVYFGIADALSPAFQADWAKLFEYYMANKMDEATSLLSSSEALLAMENAVALSEMITLFFAFLFYMSFYGLSPYLRSVIMGASPRVSNAIFVGGVRQAKGFWSDYFKAFWILLVVALVGFGAGFAVTFAFNQDYARDAVGGAAGAILLLTPLFPYYFEAAGLLMEKYRQSFSNYSINLAQRTLKQLEDAKQMSEEEAAEIKKSIDEAKKMEKENPPLPPLDDGANDDDDDDSDQPK